MKTNLWYAGPIFKNCGHSEGQGDALHADMSFQNMVKDTYSKNVANAEEILGQIHDRVDSISAAGVGQQGWTPAENAARTGEIVNQTAANSKYLSAKIGDEAAAHSGGGPGLENGNVTATKANADASVLNNEVSALQKNTAENYDAGRNNYWAATNVEKGLPGELASADSASAGAVNQSDQISNDQANQNSAANSSWMGLVGGLAGDATGLGVAKIKG